MFQGMIEPPLLEPDENSPKTLEENLPGIADFSIQRPARKWEDKKPETVDPSYKGTSISLLEDFKIILPVLCHIPRMNAHRTIFKALDVCIGRAINHSDDFSMKGVLRFFREFMCMYVNKFHYFYNDYFH